MRLSRKDRLAEELELADAERLLEHPIGARLLEASDGDVPHALRVLDELELRRRSRGELAEVIRLPRSPILDFEDVYDRELDEDEVELPRLSVGAAFWVAIAGGLLGWLILAAVAFGLYELVAWLR